MEKDEKRTIEPEELLRVLIGKELASIVFVRNYVQLLFEGLDEPQFPRLSIYSKLSIKHEGKLLTSENIDYYHLLLSCINSKVQEVFFQIDHSINVVFDNNMVFMVSLDKKDYIGHEGVQFEAPPRWDIW